MRKSFASAASLAVAICVAVQTASLHAQTAPSSAPFDFSIRNIMRGPELYGRAPENVRWSVDGRWIYFTWVEAGKPWNERRSPYRVRAVPGSTPEKLSIAQMDSAGPFVTDGPKSPDARYKAVMWNGDIYVVDLDQSSARRLTNTVEEEYNPSFSNDGRLVYFVRDNNVWSVTLATGLVSQLTDLRTTDAPPDSIKTQSPQRARLMQQQLDLLQSVRDEHRADSLAKADRETLRALHVKPIYLGKGWEISTVDIAPTGKAAIVTVRNDAKAGREAKVPFYVTESGYTEDKPTRVKVGDVDTRMALFYVPLPSGTPIKLRLFDTDSLAASAMTIGWSQLGVGAIMALAPDNKSRVIYTVASNGTLSLVENLRDSAWVDGPCVSCAGWYSGGQRLWYVSETTGFAHLYSANTTGGDRRALTSGKWEVRNVVLSPDGREFHITANEPSPAEEQFYRLSIKGGALRRITARSGGHAAVVSPNGALIADVYSYVNRPPDLFLIPNHENADANLPIASQTTRAQLTHSASDEWSRQTWVAPELITIPASDGAQVPAHIYRPSDVGAKPNGAAVLFVHGAGYLHNVGNFWSMYPREYMFNQFLARAGYVVLDLDYRASDGYGRDWRTAIYRWMGGRDLQDHVDASKYLTEKFGIPGSRVGIYGGSYGGFMTLMALFTAPDYFGAGAAIRSVTDWAHYNSGYTSNILNFPQTDTLAYRRSSPIYFAEGLRAPLLMCHGMQDINVHYQDIIRLTERLIELGKPNWELATYPVEDHAFVRPASWTDEYTRIFNLFERSIGRPTPSPTAAAQ